MNCPKCRGEAESGIDIYGYRWWKCPKCGEIRGPATATPKPKPKAKPKPEPEPAKPRRKKIKPRSWRK